MTPLPKSKTKLKSRQNLQFQFDAIGTRWQIDIYDSIGDDTAEKLLTVIKRRIATFDKNYSRFRDDSLIAHMAQKPGTYHLPSDAQPMFDLYKQLYSLTDGTVTPLIGQLLADAGYDAAYSLEPGELHRVPTWDEALEYDFPELTIKQPALLDVGAAGKGYAVDIIGELLTRHGVDAFCVDAGGDMLHHDPSQKILRIGLEHPDDPQQVIGVADITNQSICGSSGNRRTWDKFHHIMDPHTRNSPQHIRAAWVVADAAMLADALTTCLFFVPAAELQKQYNFAYAIVRQDYSLEHSGNFPATFFTEQKELET